MGAEIRVDVLEYFNADGNDACLYDLVIDVGRYSVAEAVVLICKNPRHKLKE